MAHEEYTRIPGVPRSGGGNTKMKGACYVRIADPSNLVAVPLLASKWHDKPAHQPFNDEGVCEPQRARLEMFAIWSFVVFGFAALLFCAYKSALR